MPGVKFVSATNSTFFTTCCDCAICDDQKKCPSCGKDITPFDHEGRWNQAMYGFYGKGKVLEMREKIREKWRK